jgi:NAD(P)-dependent dehydrogenase (short-subunit alcohol dehydrogenase family)
MQRRLVVVTGAGRRHACGAAIVNAFLRSGYKVSACDLAFEPETAEWWNATIKARIAAEPADVAAAVGASRLYLEKCDLTSEDAVKAFVAATAAAFPEEKKWCLVNNAAVSSPTMPTQSLESMDIAYFRKVLEINLVAPLLMAKCCAPYLLAPAPPQERDAASSSDRDRDRGGSIINISSTRAVMCEPHGEGYNSSKGGLEALTRSLAMSNAGRLRVNTVRLGWVDTGLFAVTEKDHEFHPAGRVGKPNDVAEACLFLADAAKSGFMTGQALTIDGGVTVKMIYPEEE